MRSPFSFSDKFGNVSQINKGLTKKMLKLKRININFKR